MWRFYTFITDVAERRVLRGGKRTLSPQEITFFRAETGRFWPTIPTQKAVLYKDLRNITTPPERSSHPPQGTGPPFNSEKRRSGTPCQGLPFCIKVLKVIKSDPSGHPIF